MPTATVCNHRVNDIQAHCMVYYAERVLALYPEASRSMDSFLNHLGDELEDFPDVYPGCAADRCGLPPRKGRSGWFEPMVYEMGQWLWRQSNRDIVNMAYSTMLIAPRDSAAPFIFTFFPVRCISYEWWRWQADPADESTTGRRMRGLVDFNHFSPPPYPPR